MQAYGLTETTGAAFLTVPKDNVIGSVGPPLPGVEGKIIDPQPQEEGGPATGEIAIRGAVVMKGYWNRPDATAAVLKDGWLLTGDLGHFDARGNLVITGRKKDVIVLSNGKNIYPEEIEAHYSKSPYIKEICVMGLEAKPGDPTSERLHAVIVPNFEMLKRQRISNAKEVIRFDIETFSAQLPSTKRIGSYEIWPEDLPHTTTRKLKRFEIEKRVRANQARGQSDDSEVASERPLSADDTAWLEQPEVQGALKIVRESAKSAPDVIRPGDNLELDLGFDSMQRVELLVALEEELGGDVEESRLADIYTVRELVDTVRESAASGKTTIPRPSCWLEGAVATGIDRSGGPCSRLSGTLRRACLLCFESPDRDLRFRSTAPACCRPGKASRARPLHHFFESPELCRSCNTEQRFALVRLSRFVFGGNE